MVWLIERSSLWDPPPRRISPKRLLHAPHRSCGDVPGSPRASSPEFQAWLGSVPAERPCSSGACSSPAPHRREGQGNMPPLRGQGSTSMLAPCAARASCPAGLTPSLSPTESQPPSAASCTLRVSVSPGHPPTSQGLASTPAPSTFPGHVVHAPAGGPAGAPWRWGQGAGPPSAGCERVVQSKSLQNLDMDVEATPSPQRKAWLPFADTHTRIHLSHNLRDLPASLLHLTQHPGPSSIPDLQRHPEAARCLAGQDCFQALGPRGA